MRWPSLARWLNALHYTLDGCQNAIERRHALAELPASRRRNGVVAGLAAGRRLTMLRDDETVPLESLESWIQRAVFDVEHAAGQPLDVLRYRIAVHGLHGQRLEDQHVERSFQKLVLRLRDFAGWCHEA